MWLRLEQAGSRGSGFADIGQQCITYRSWRHYVRVKYPMVVMVMVVMVMVVMVVEITIEKRGVDRMHAV
jgi:hypothetical protein